MMRHYYRASVQFDCACGRSMTIVRDVSAMDRRDGVPVAFDLDSFARAWLRDHAREGDPDHGLGGISVVAEGP